MAGVVADVLIGSEAMLTAGMGLETTGGRTAAVCLVLVMSGGVDWVRVMGSDVGNVWLVLGCGVVEPLASEDTEEEGTPW